MRKCLIFVLLLCSLLFLFGQTSKAVMTGDMLNEYKSNINTLYDKGIIGENTKNYLISNAGDSISNTTATGYFFIIGRGNNGNYQSNLLSTDIYLYVGICRNVNNVRDSSNGITWTTNGTSGGLYVSRIGLNATTASTGSYGLNNLVDGFWCYTTQNIRTSILTLDAYDEYGYYYITNSLYFEPFLEPQKVFNGVTYNIKNISRSVPEWRLGTIYGLETNKYRVYVQYYTGQYWSSAFKFDSTAIGSSDEVYVDNSKILYNNAYRIFIQQEDRITDNCYFIFLPLGQEFSGDLVSGDLFYTGFDNNDNFNITNTIDNSVAGITTALTDYSYSGDITSGDIYGIVLEDPSSDFFTWLYNNLMTILLSNQNTTLNIPIYNTNNYIRSDVFVLSIEPLRTFISLGWWFVCGVPLFKWLRRTIESVRTGNVPQSDDKSDLLGHII